MLLVTPNLHFPGTCMQAIQLYQAAFGARVTQLIVETELVFHGEICIGDQRITMNDDTTGQTSFGNTVSLLITFQKAEDVQDAYRVLSEGGTILHPMQSTSYSSCFVSLVDRYGVRWELMTEQTDQ